MTRETQNAPQLSGRLVRPFWALLGFVSIFLAAIGVVLPLLPTTPLVILAAFAFGKSIPALQRRLEQSRSFGPIIAEWRANGAIAPRYKAIAVTMMVAVIAISIWREVSTMVIGIQSVCLAAAALFVLSRPNGPPTDLGDAPPTAEPDTSDPGRPASAGTRKTSTGS
jgi:uncharacterized membrane protein YbaN (DUF454 family)